MIALILFENFLDLKKEVKQGNSENIEDFGKV